MHFSVEDTTLASDGDGSKYWLFNVHVNGVMYCSLRYSQLDKLNEQLKKEYSSVMAECTFPPKKLFSLSPSQLEERRTGLEQFIQFVSQDSEIASSDTFNDFFSKAMQDTRKDHCKDVEISVHLMNGNKVTVPILSIDSTEDVLVTAMQKIGLKEDLTSYFALFLVGLEEDKSLSVIRKLQDFEAPYLTLQDAGENHRIVIRKNYWSSRYDSDLLEDRIAMNLLYVQVVDDLDRGWILASDDELKKLLSLKKSGSRKEFLKVCRSLKYYGYMHFKTCICDYPEEKSSVVICAGEREFSMRVSSKDNKVLEGNFMIQRIKSWRLSSLVQSSSDDMGDLAFTFEYLFTKDDLRWISVISKQAVFMSMCMQGMVDEILREQQNKPMRMPRSKSRSSSSSSSKSAESNKTPVQSPSNGKRDKEPATNNASSKSSKKSSNKSKSGLVGKKSDKNEVFENIGDDDL